MKFLRPQSGTNNTISSRIKYKTETIKITMKNEFLYISGYNRVGACIYNILSLINGLAIPNLCLDRYARTPAKVIPLAVTRWYSGSNLNFSVDEQPHRIPSTQRNNVAKIRWRKFNFLKMFGGLYKEYCVCSHKSMEYLLFKNMR